MGNSGFALASIFGAFILYIIVKGEGSTYLGFFTVSASAANGSSTQQSTVTTLPQITIPQSQTQGDQYGSNPLMQGPSPYTTNYSTSNAGSLLGQL